MKKSYLPVLVCGVCLQAIFPSVDSATAAEPSPPAITNLTVGGGQVNFDFPPYPAVDAYTILSGTNLASPLVPNPGFFPARSTNYTTNATAVLTNIFYQWRLTNALGGEGFYRVQITPMNSNAVLAATVLNRLAYGPTPDELERIVTGSPAYPTPIGAQAYIDEQMAPELITETVASSHTNVPLIEARFAQAADVVVTNTGTHATLNDLKAWFTLRGVGARRQTLEILLQFLENHFVTQSSKSDSYLSSFLSDSNLRNRLSAQFEYLEIEKWRAALLNPTCTFYDLLRISAEGPAMIIYLDTVNSRGNGSNIANENYARELFELFCNGVDNGYDQNDITVMSRCWTGWSVEKVAVSNAFNPFASAMPGSKSTNVGVWAFNYKSANHNTTTKTIFPGKIVPARFGAPWTTKTYGANSTPGLYQLVVPGRSGTNGINEGYEVIQSLANLPFTQEYICIKLCRLFVHDDFPNPSNDTNSPSYAFYNYAAGNLSPEAELVRQCMLAWENGSPKGQIRAVLQTILGSELFRTQGAAQQKIKTPLEFVISSVRALRSPNGSGGFTADTDGFNLNTPLNRMGGMDLFNRGDPDGYPENAVGWISGGTLTERLRFAAAFCIAVGQSGHSDIGNNTWCSPVALVTNKLAQLTPPGSPTSAENVADYFLSILFPGEGAGNLSLYRQAAINFLNDGSADTDITPDYRNTQFSGLPVNATPGQPYDERVRGMVGLLMSFQRFQEQ